MADAVICTLVDAQYFAGLVALVNSLYLQGSLYSLLLLDNGLTAAQRERVRPYARLSKVPARLADRGFMTKSYLAEVAPAGVLIWLDSDMIVTAPLEDVVEQAAAGRICVIRDDWPAGVQRWFPEWEPLLGLRSPVRPHTYVNAGFFALSTIHWPTFLSRWSQACERIPTERIWHGHPISNPVWSGDQDAFNAVMMSEFPEEALYLLHASEMVHRRTIGQAVLRNSASIEVTYDGRGARFLHYSYQPKPWTTAGWVHGPDPYVELLPRLLFANDVPLRLERSDVPPWLWPGVTGRVARGGIASVRTLRRQAGRTARMLPPGAQNHVFVVRDRIDSWLGAR